MFCSIQGHYPFVFASMSSKKPLSFTLLCLSSSLYLDNPALIHESPVPCFACVPHSLVKMDFIEHPFPCISTSYLFCFVLFDCDNVLFPLLLNSCKLFFPPCLRILNKSRMIWKQRLQF